MRRPISWTMIVGMLLCLLAACGAGETPASPSPPPGQVFTSNGDLVPLTSPEPVTREVTIVDTLQDSGIVMVGEGLQGIVLSGMPEPGKIHFARADMGGELQPGMTAQIEYDGTVRFTAPGQISVDELTVTGDDGGFFQLFFDALEELIAYEPALNENVEYLGLDLDEVRCLTAEEAWAVCYGFPSNHGMTNAPGKAAVLIEDGYIDSVKTYWEDGMLLRLKASHITGDSFTLEGTKWRSSQALAKLSFSAKKADGRWSLEVTDEIPAA